MLPGRYGGHFSTVYALSFKSKTAILASCEIALSVGAQSIEDFRMGYWSYLFPLPLAN